LASGGSIGRSERGTWMDNFQESIRIIYDGFILSIDEMKDQIVANC